MGLINYVRDTQGELKHVSWPTRKQAFAFTALVIVISLVVALYLGLLDYIFSFILGKLIG